MHDIGAGLVAQPSQDRGNVEHPPSLLVLAGGLVRRSAINSSTTDPSPVQVAATSRRTRSAS
ncbi:MAG: hypothetical protein M3228_09980 [Actinomycetota bacterium]|nr:hypothetical protein [Actinomycetota bacterium]